MAPSFTDTSAQAAAHEPKKFVKVEGAGHHNLSGAGFDDYRAAIAERIGGSSLDWPICRAYFLPEKRAPEKRAP